MTKKKSEPLYKDERLKIDYHPNSHEDHLLFIKNRNGVDGEYIIPRGVLREMALTKRGGIERMLSNFNPAILYSIQKGVVETIGVDGLHVAICQAYAEEERRINDYIRKERI